MQGKNGRKDKLVNPWVFSKRVVWVGLVGLSLLGLFETGGNANPQSSVPGTIRVRVTLVPVDVRVTDKNDKPVPNLKKEDFVVFENGVRQDIKHFSLQTLTATSPEAGAKPLLRKVPRMELVPQTDRTFLILLGRGRLQRPFKNIDSLIRFVREDLLPQDRLAVFAYNRATDFTTDHEQVAQVLERYKKIHEKIEAGLELRFAGLAAIYGSKDIPKSFRSDIDKVFEAPGAVGSRQVPPGRITNSGQWAQDSRRVTDTMQRMEAGQVASDARRGFPDDPSGSPVSPFEQLEVESLTDLPFEQYVATNAMTMQDLQNIYTSIEYLRYMGGEKHLLFFTENGLFLPRLENDKSIAAMANDARVTIDTFQTGGVYSDQGVAPLDLFGDRPRRSGFDPQPRRFNKGSFSRTFALSSLRNISELTGGHSSIHSDVSAPLERVNETTRAEYLLGYYPKNNNWDGQYRRITVKVNRPDVKVSFRHGYYARETLEPFDREAFLSYSRITAAAGYNQEVKDIRFEVTATKDKSTPDNPQARVDLIIDPSNVSFQTQDGLYKGKLQIAIFYGDSEGRNLGDEWETMVMNLREETYQRVQKEGIPYSTRIPLQAPNESLKVVVYNYDNDKVGSLFAKVR